MADNLGDYGNFWSGDYWNPRAKAQRDRDRKAQGQKLGQEQSKARTGEWNAIGTGLGVAGAITSFINSLPANRRKEEQKTAIANSGPAKKAFNWEAGNLALRPNEPDFVNRGATRATHDDIPASTYRDGPGPQSPLEILMERLNQGYQGPDPSKMNFEALDRALNMRLGQIDGARNQVQGNFKESDANLEGMHKAFENQIRTKDAARYNQIADQAKSNLNKNTQTVTGALQASRSQEAAERMAMLKALGQEQSAGAVDPNAAIFNEGITTANLRNDTNQTMADEQRAGDLAYNNTVAQSVGQAGVQRRSALQNQLQGILGKLSMAEAEARTQNETERQRAISSAGNAGYEQWNDQQNRNLDLFKILSGEELAREKMSMDTNAPRATGMGALAQDLGSILPQEEASMGIATLNKVLSGGNYLQGAQGEQGNQPFDKRAVLIQKLKNEGLPEHIATAVGIAYGDQ